MYKKSQASVEFVILIAAVFFFFTLFFLAIQANMSDKIREKHALAVKDIAINVRDEINLASSSSNGYSRSFNIPEKIGNIDYDINLTQGFVYILTSDNKHSIAIQVEEVTGEIKKGLNTIRKENGQLYLN